MIIIDGYNLLFAQKDEVTNLESDRTTLLELIGKYNSKKGAAIKLVFDVKNNVFAFDSKTKTERGKIGVIFSPKGTSADDYIIELVRDSENKGGIIVVSSDRKIISAIKKMGAQTISSPEFLIQLRGLLKADPSDEYYFEKEHGISKSEVDYWLKVFGLDKK